MFRRTAAALAIPMALALGVTACGDAADGLLPEGVVADVDGTEVSADTLNGIVASVAPEEATPEETVEAERSVLTSLIQSVIATDLAAEEGIELSDDERATLAEDNAEQVSAEAEQFGMSEEDYLTYVLEPNEVVQRLYEELGGEVSDAEVEDAYDQMVAAGQTETATISHILVATEAEAIDAIARIAGGESFEDVAADVSTDPGSAANGGALGPDMPLSQFVEPFANAAREAEIGEITDPVESDFGFHVLRVDDRTIVTFEDMEDQLREQVQQANAQVIAQETLAVAFVEAEVTIPSRIGVWDGEAGGVVAEDAVGEAPAPTGEIAPAEPTEVVSDS